MIDLLRDYAPFILLAALGVFWFFMRTKGSEVTPGSALGGIIGNGRPTVMEFFSNT